MCKVGGPRCNGSHIPSARQRAKRKANKKYRRVLADTIEAKTGDAELAKRVRQANMTDLHEIAALSGISEEVVAATCMTESYTSPDGEKTVVKVEAPGQTRRTAPSDESKQLFADVFAATSKRGPLDDGTEFARAMLDGDRERADEIQAEVDEIADWVYETYNDPNATWSMTDDELTALASVSRQKWNEAQRLAGPDAIDARTAVMMGRAEERLALRGLRADGTGFGFDTETELQPLEKKDDESAEYTKARKLSERYANGVWAGTGGDFIRNRAMFEELADRASDDDARAKYQEMAGRMEYALARESGNFRFSDDQKGVLVTRGTVNAAIHEGRSDKAMADMYDEIDGLKAIYPGGLEASTLEDARSDLGKELDRRGIACDRYARDEMERARRRSTPPNLEEVTPDQLAGAMERLTTARSKAYRRSDNPEVRAEADALAAPVAAEFAKRVSTMDDLTLVPAYMWPENTEGKTLPSKDELREDAEYYYGLRDASPRETPGLAEHSDVNAPTLAGIDPSGTAVYRDGASLYRLAQPSNDDMPNAAHRRAYNGMRLDNAWNTPHSDDVDISDTSDAKAFAAAAAAYDGLADWDNGRLGGAPAQAAQAKKFLDTHPVRDDQRFEDADMHLLADRVCAATAAEEAVATTRPQGVDAHAMSAYASYQAQRERERLAAALDTQLARGGTYQEFVKDHGMSYKEAFKIVSEQDGQGVYEPLAPQNVQRVKDELAAAEREGREPKKSVLSKALKHSGPSEKKYKQAHAIMDTVNSTLGEDDVYAGAMMLRRRNRTAASWARSGIDGNSLDHVVDTSSPLNPLGSTSFDSRTQADLAASYIRHQSSNAIAASLAEDVPTVRDDNTYVEARVPKGRVTDKARADLLTLVEEQALNSYEYGDGAMRGITRNAAGKQDVATAAKNYPVVYAAVVSHIGSEHEYQRDHEAPESAEERAWYNEVSRARGAYVKRLRELYDKSEAGDTDAAEELVDTAAAAYADDTSFMRTRQYVDPDQESLF